MNKKTVLILFIVICFICSVGEVSAHEGMENPIVTIDDYMPGQEVSGDVNFNVTVHEHNEVKYVNVTAEHMESHTKYFDKQDSNPSDGWSVSWDTSNSPNGEYWITATACDVKELQGKAEMKLILNNIPKESTIVLENVTTVVNKSTNLFANLIDSNSNPISDKPVEFIIDGNSYSANTTNGGVATISFTPKEVKNYKVIVKFVGDYRYLESQSMGMLNVMSNINTSSVTIHDIRGNNKEKIILKANLVCPGLYDANINKKIEFYVNGNFIGYNFTDEKGDAMLEYVINETGGSYVYQARYQNGSGENFTDSASLYVPQSELYMTMNAVTYSKDGIFTVGNTFELNYFVNNNGPDSASDVKVLYDVPDSLKYVKATATQGTVGYDSNTRKLVWDLGSVSVGSQNVAITFTVLKADKINLSPSITTSTYDESVNNNITRNTLVVKSYKLVASDLTKYFTGNQKYRIYLKDGDGKAVSGAKITFTFNKNTQSLRTNANGYIELDTKNVKVGTFTIKATCNGLKISKKITVKPLLIAKNLSKKKSKITKFSVKLVNNKGKAVAGKKLTFKFKGKKYTAKTNKKGIATVSLKNLKVGKYSITTTYGKSSIKNTIKIKK